jgi:hypothetical protein
MGKYLINPAVNEEPEKSIGSVYDLCAVINHLGQSISMGHYTSFARTHDKQNTAKNEIGWRYFDDQRVVPVDAENHVLTKDAYVLMYRLRSTGEHADCIEETNEYSTVTNQLAGESENVVYSGASSNLCATTSQQIVGSKNQSESDFEPIGQSEEFYDVDSDESAQLNDEDEDRDDVIDLSENEGSLDEKMVMSVNNSVLMQDFTNLDETD